MRLEKDQQLFTDVNSLRLKRNLVLRQEIFEQLKKVLLIALQTVK